MALAPRIKNGIRGQGLHGSMLCPQLRNEADNIWAIIDLKACTVEQRWTFPSAQTFLTTPWVRSHMMRPPCLIRLPAQALCGLCIPTSLHAQPLRQSCMHCPVNLFFQASVWGYASQ